MAEARTEPREGGAGGLLLGVAIATAAIVAAVFAWWALKQGAYFGSTFFPGAILLYALLAMLIYAAPLRFRIGGPGTIALAALTGLALWTLLSFAWTDFHDGAVQDFERVFAYASCFALGACVCNLAGRRMQLPLAAVAATGALVGVVVVFTLAFGDHLSAYVHDDATLRYPIGYRNANACFFLICLWPTATLAAEGEMRWQLRVLLIGVATMLLDLMVLSQSRGSLPAATLGLIALIALTPHRLRVATYLAIATVPVIAVLPTLLDPFQHGAGPGLLPLLRSASHATALSAIGSLLLATVCLRGIESRLHLGKGQIRLISRVIAGAAILIVVVGGTVFVSKRGGPIKFIDQRASEFSAVGYPSFKGKNTRYGTNVGSNRHDFWRVSLHQLEDHPLGGGGAGSFAAAYAQKRQSDETPKDPHSVEMLVASELGLVGLLLLAIFYAGTGVAAARSRRLGPVAAVLVAGAIASAADWLLHSAYDWFWLYPAVTAPVMFLAGAAAAPGQLSEKKLTARPGRWIAIGALAAAILIAVPLFLSQRYQNQAYGEATSDPAAAFDDLNQAASLDPFDPDPLLAKGVLALRLNEPGQAVQPFHEALGRQSNNYATHFFLARALRSSDLGAARAQAAEALRLNPTDPDTKALNRSLQSGRGG